MKLLRTILQTTNQTPYLRVNVFPQNIFSKILVVLILGSDHLV